MADRKGTQETPESAGDQILVGNIQGSYNAIGPSASVSVVYQGLTVTQVADLLAQLKQKDQPKVWNGHNPYLGLRAFRQEDAQYFFGRETLVEELIERVQQAQFVAVAGPSGSGKSSVARAGLLHALKQNRIDGSSRWLLATMSPQGDPIGNLALAMQRATGQEAIGPKIIAEHPENPQLLAEAIEMYLTDDKRQRCLLLVDQFEEIFTQTKDSAIQAAFIRLLTGAVQSKTSRMIVLLSMRSDFVSHCVRFPALRQLMSQQMQLVGAMAPDELVKAISLPAMTVGAEIDPALVSQIAADMEGEPGALPLMSFALRDLFDAEKTKPGATMDMTLPEYLDRGGIKSALERHANQVFATFTEEEKGLAKNIFSRLIEVGQGRVDTRRTASFTELVPDGQESENVSVVIRAFAHEDVRLLTTNSQDVAGTDDTLATVTVAHEKLIDAWPWLRSLVDENREMIALQNEINRDALAWEQGNEDVGFLYRGGRLLQAEEKLAQHQPNLDVVSHKFIQASIEQRQQEIVEEEAQREREIAQAQALAEAQTREAEEQKRRAQLTRWGLAIVGVLLIIAIGAALFGFGQANEASNAQVAAVNAQETAVIDREDAVENAILADTRAQEAQNAQSTAESAEATAVVDRNSAIANENIASTRVVEAQNAEATAEAERLEAERQGRVALAQSLAALSATVNDPDQTDTDVNLLLALEALHLHHENGGNVAWLAEQSMRQIFSRPDLRDVLVRGHTNFVSSVAFSPDGQQIVSGSWDQTIRVWDVDQPEAEPVILAGHTNFVLSVAFSPDGQQIVSGSRDGTIRVWDVSQPEAEPLILAGHTGGVESVAYSPDGERIVSGGADNTIRVWDVDQPEAEPVILAGHTNFVSSVAFSPDGQQIVSGSWDRTIRVWDVTQPEAEPMILAGHIDSVLSVAFSPDGQQIVSGGQTIRVWDVSQPEAEPVILAGHTGSVFSVAFSPDGQQIVSGSSVGTIRVWDVFQPEAEPMILAGHVDIVQSVAFSPDGQQIVSGSRDGTIRVWDVTQPEAETVILYDHTTSVQSVGVSLDGEQIVSGGGQTIRVWDVSQPEAETVISAGHVFIVESVAFSPDGEQIVSGGWEQTGVWDLNRPEAEPVILAGQRGASSVAFSPDGQQIVSGSNDQKIRVWDVTQPEAEPVILAGHVDIVESVAFSPDGQQIVSGSNDQTIRVWDLNQPEAEPLILAGHTGGVESVAYSPDGERIVSGGADNTIRVWDLNQPEAEPVILAGHTGSVLSVAFSPDGQQIVSGSWDQTIRVWPTLSRLAILACQQVSRGKLTETEWEFYVGDILPWRKEGQCDLERGVPVWWSEE